MKTTEHFEHVLAMRPEIKREWCEQIAQRPARRGKTPRGRIICWGWVEDVRLKHYVRVVLLEDGETLHTAMVDSGFKGGTK